jgi:DNA-directed RNA polymerase specialized sigma24 family protein
MSSERATTGEAEREDAGTQGGDRAVGERAEEIVERVSGQVARFARRVVGRAREEVEDIVAEGQTIRRRDRRGG